MEEIIIQKLDENILVCVLENSEIVEKYLFDINNSSTIGNVYVGSVKEIFDGMQAAFVDIGLEKKAFLSLKDALPKIDIVNVEQHDKLASGKLSKIIEKDQILLLQIRKEAFEDKGPRVSTHITLAGNYLVLMPETEIITVSQKISSQTEKERILKIIKANLPVNYGCIIRTDAENVSDDVLIEDLKNVIDLWNEIKKNCKIISDEIKVGKLSCNENDEQNTNNTCVQRLIYNDNDIVAKIARDMVRKTTKKIYVNDEVIFSRLRLMVDENKIEIKENKDFIKDFGLQSELEKTENRKIWLKCGGHIIIDKTEALTAIDVNSSRCTGNESLEKTILKVNKEAAVEVMKQIRLKDIGGIIIVDFIDMHKQENKEEILRIMREEQKKDRSKIEVKDFTQLNLVEMTRKKMYV